MYGTGDDAVVRAGREALDANKKIAAIAKGGIKPENGAEYAKEARALAEIAELVKRDVGLRVAWLDVGGWDTHQGQGDGEKGRLARLSEGLAKSLSALRADLGDRFQKVAVLVMTEFGRTVRENGTGGTDHGHASVMFLMGGSVKGGKVYGRWPGLEPEQRFEQRDLEVTTDFRDVFVEVAEKHLGVREAGSILGVPPERARLGLIRG
jgi:uncharacterized protein (DUF1501 family)